MPMGNRWGIWGENPYGPNVADTALDTAKDVSGLLSSYFKNKYMPQNQDADLAIKHAQLGTLGARQNLYRAQAAHANYMAGLTQSMGKAGYIPDGMGSWVKDPRMGTQRSGAGGTYNQPDTGQSVSTNTTQQASRDQRAVAGINNALGYTANAAQKLAPYQTLGGQANLGASKFGNWALGHNNPEPSDYASGRADLMSSTEGLVNAFGLNSTGENVNKVQAIIEPQAGESQAGYLNRIHDELTQLKAQQDRATGRLRTGTDISVSPEDANAGRVRVISPEGKSGTISAANLQEALKKGYKQAE
jgi:hypothetical protein